MATPSKFDMGGIPRTKTGLVPWSYRQQIDNVSTPTQWSKLPPKPKQTMYPYRGDFVKERKKQTKNRQRLSEKSFEQNSNINSGTTSSSTKPHVAKITPKWDPYCKQISCHRLIGAEKEAKTQNKMKFIAYLRSEASKRPDKKRIQKKDEDARPAVRKRKPHVPRLSHLARSRENKENNQRHRSVPCTISKRSLPSKENQQKGKSLTKEKNAKSKGQYLDFISNKRNEIPKSQQKPDKSMPVANFSLPSEDKHPDLEECEDSQFRCQIERIVQKAAAMALSEQHSASLDSSSDFVSNLVGNVTSSAMGIEEFGEDFNYRRNAFSKSNTDDSSSLGTCSDNKSVTDISQPINIPWEQFFCHNSLKNTMHEMNSSCTTSYCETATEVMTEKEPIVFRPDQSLEQSVFPSERSRDVLSEPRPRDYKHLSPEKNESLVEDLFLLLG